MRRGDGLANSKIDAWHELRTGPYGELHETVEGCCRAWGVPVKTLASRMRAGMSPSEAYRLPRYGKRTNPWFDHEGRRFESKRALCRAWGITTGMLDARMERGWPIKDALTLPKHTHIRTVMRKRGELSTAGGADGRGAGPGKDA